MGLYGGCGGLWGRGGALGFMGYEGSGVVAFQGFLMGDLGGF